MTDSQGGEEREMDGPISFNQVQKGGQMVMMKKPATGGAGLTTGAELTTRAGRGCAAMAGLAQGLGYSDRVVSHLRTA